jgi:hypothetical protein
MNLRTYNKYKLLSDTDKEEFSMRFHGKPDWDGIFVWSFVLVLGVLAAGFFLSMSTAMTALGTPEILPYASSLALAELSLQISTLTGSLGVAFKLVYNLFSLFEIKQFLKERVPK